jgi:hypothetical protein
MYKRISGRHTAYLERNLEDTAFGGYMKEGLQTAEITDIRLHESAADIVFTNSNRETLLQRFFFHNFNKSDQSYLYKQLVASTAHSPSEIWKFLDNPESVTDVQGRRVKLVIGNNGGVPYKRVPEGYEANGVTASSLTALNQILITEQQVKLYREEIKEIHSADSTQESTEKPQEGNHPEQTNDVRRRKIPANLEF